LRPPRPAAPRGRVEEEPGAFAVVRLFWHAGPVIPRGVPGPGPTRRVSRTRPQLGDQTVAHFFTIPDFDIQTRGFSPRCQLCGSPKASKDSIVFRGPMIEHEGYFDICANCVREMASRLGLVTKERHDVAR